MDLRQNPRIKKFHDLVVERLGDAYAVVVEVTLLDSSLEGVNPWDQDLDDETKAKILAEAEKNINYFQWIVTGCKVRNLDTVPPSSQAIKVLYEAISQQLTNNIPFDQWDENLSATDVEETLKEIALCVNHGIRTQHFQSPLSELASSLVDTCAILLRRRELNAGLLVDPSAVEAALADPETPL